MVAEAFYPVAQLGEGGCRCAPGKSASHDDNQILPFVRWIYQAGLHLVLRPLLVDRTGRNGALEAQGHRFSK